MVVLLHTSHSHTRTLVIGIVCIVYIACIVLYHAVVPQWGQGRPPARQMAQINALLQS